MQHAYRRRARRWRGVNRQPLPPHQSLKLWVVQYQMLQRALDWALQRQALDYLRYSAQKRALARSLAASAQAPWRSGSNQRLYRQAFTVLGLGVGAALGPVAVKGIGGAVTAFRGLEGRMLGKINQAVETSGAQLRQADEAALAAGGQGRSVGAAETPAGEIDAGVSLENRALQAGDQAGADLMEQPRMEQMAARAQELDMPVPIGFGSRAMSPARILQQANEYQPFGDTVNKSIMNRQEAKVSEYMSGALGIKPKAALFVDDLADAETEIGNKFNLVRDRMPNVDGEAIAKALKGGGPGKAGAFGSFKATKQINDAVDNARGRPIFDGEEFMNTRKRLAAKMAKAYKFGEEEDGDVFMSALTGSTICCASI